MNDQQPTTGEQSVTLRLASSNPNPVRHIPPEACETIRRLIRTRQEVFELIEQLESEVRMSFDDFRILETLDLDYPDWPTDQQITPDDARTFIKKARGEAMLDADRWQPMDVPDNVVSVNDWILGYRDEKQDN